MTLVPPILICSCPAGHLWARLDPRWLAGITHPRPTRKLWCPAHQAERKAAQQAKINAKKLARSREYDAMPLPATKVCTNKESRHHPAGAVLPITDFYLRPGKKRTDGSRATFLDSQCKACRRDQAEQRRKKQPLEERRRYQHNYRKRKREQARRAKQRRVHNPTLVDATAFLEWAEVVQPQYTATEARMIARAVSNGRKLEHHIVDAVMTRYGATDQLAIFYG